LIGVKKGYEVLGPSQCPVAGVGLYARSKEEEKHEWDDEK